MRPSFIPKRDSTYIKKEAKAITQTWHKNGECPENTVPIRRIKKEDILRGKSIDNFGKKTHQSSPGGHEVHLYALSLCYYSLVRKTCYHETQITFHLFWSPFSMRSWIRETETFTGHNL